MLPLFVHLSARESLLEDGTRVYAPQLLVHLLFHPLSCKEEASVKSSLKCLFFLLELPICLLPTTSPPYLIYDQVTHKLLLYTKSNVTSSSDFRHDLPK